MPKQDPELGERSASKRKRRTASVYEVVAGHVGPNGFLSADQKASSSVRPLAPEEVLLRNASRTDAPTDQYNTEQSVEDSGTDLPDSDLLKAVHVYAADFYDMATIDHGRHDFRSLDGSALIAFGCLLEEATRQTLGQNGDMVLVEPRGLENGLPETSLSRHQVIGKVKPPPTPEQVSEDSGADTENEPAKKRRG